MNTLCLNDKYMLKVIDYVNNGLFFVFYVLTCAQTFCQQSQRMGGLPSQIFFF